MNLAPNRRLMQNAMAAPSVALVSVINIPPHTPKSLGDINVSGDVGIGDTTTPAIINIENKIGANRPLSRNKVSIFSESTCMTVTKKRNTRIREPVALITFFHLIARSFQFLRSYGLRA